MARIIAPAMPTMVWFWTGGVLLLSVWHVCGWIGIVKLRRTGFTPNDATVAVRMRQLAVRLNVKRPVRLLESTRVAVPTVLGSWRPMILMPAGLLGGIPVDQLDAILAHELAHIRRHDYLVNLLQTVAETLLFFQPAVWWVSRQVRLDREHCADELAVTTCYDRFVYAKALTTITECTGRLPHIAVAASGGSLSKRIHRILNVPTDDPPLAQSWLAGALVSFSLLIVLVAWPLLPIVANTTRPDGDLSLSTPSTEITHEQANRADGDHTDASELGDVSNSTVETGTAEFLIAAEQAGEVGNRVEGASEEVANAAPEATTDSGKRTRSSAVAKAIAYLRSKQQPSGSWRSKNDRHVVETERPLFESGVTSLCALALIRSGVKPSDPQIQKTLTFVRGKQSARTYEVALQTLLLCAAEPKKDITQIRTNARRFEAAQSDSGTDEGGCGYFVNRNLSRFPNRDGSNTEFALWALHEARKAGVQVNTKTWKHAHAYWKNRQNANGSWGYRGMNSGGTGSMTCAGIASLLICAEHLHNRTDNEDQSAEFDVTDNVSLGLDWLDNSYTVKDNPGAHSWQLYYLVMLRRAGNLAQSTIIGDNNWRSDTTKFLVDNQNKRAGSWRAVGFEADPVIATGLALEEKTKPKHQ